MEGANGDWRSKLPADYRQSIINKIMDTLRRHPSSSGHEEVQELMKLATRFEQNDYHAATSQSDYVRRISLKMLTMESKSNPPGPMPNAMPFNSTGMSKNSQDPASQSMQPQMQKQGQALPIRMASNQPTAQGRPRLLTQNIQSNINNAGVQSSATALQPHTQQQTQQNNLLPSAQLQSSQRSVMQNSSVMQPSTVSGLQQNQPSSIKKSSQFTLQRHQQSSLPSTHQQQFKSQTLVVGTLPQQEQMLGSQSASLDATAQTGNSDTQEEVYQKIKVLKDLYFADVLDIYQTICSKLQQYVSLSQQAKPEASARLKFCKQILERILQCLQIPKNSAQHIHKDRPAMIEKQILSVLKLHGSKKSGPPLQQGQILRSHMQSLQQNQQSHSQIPQNQSHESGVISQLLSVNVQGSSVPTMQPGHMSGSSLYGITSSQQNMMNSLQPGSKLDSGQGSAVGSIQQNPVSAPQRANPQTGVNLLHSSVNSVLPNSNMLQQILNTPGIAPASSPAIATPGISASPLLTESSLPDAHGATLNTLPGKSGVTGQPFERLLKVVKSMSSKALNSAVGHIISVVIMIDQIAGSAPGNGSRAAVGEDLVVMTKNHLQARNFITQDGSSGMKRLRHYTSAMPLNVASSVGSPNYSFKQLTGSETFELESTATSSVKRRRIQVNPAILEEIKEVNEHLIHTVVDLSNENVDPTLSAVAVEGGEGTIVKCTFSTMSLCPNLKSQYCSAQMSPIQPLRLFVPANYPNCSPILLDKFPVEVSNEYDDLSVKVKSRFSISLRALSQPMSLREIARTWDDCARSVITEYAQLSGGGTFSSKYGTWENCLIAN